MTPQSQIKIFNFFLKFNRFLTIWSTLVVLLTLLLQNEISINFVVIGIFSAVGWWINSETISLLKKTYNLEDDDKSTNT